MLRWLKAGGGIAITPDGPRGPVERMTDGPPLLARMARAPTLLVGLASRPCVTLNSWDHAILPLPFTRGAICWRRLADVTARDDLETLRGEWAAALSALTRRAEQALA